MPPLDGIPAGELVVAGHNGSAEKACGQSLPIVRHEPTATGCVLDLESGRVGPWDPWEVVKAHAGAGDITLFPEDQWVPFPAAFAAAPPPGQLLVLATPLALLEAVHAPPGAAEADWRAGYQDWVWVTPAGPVARVGEREANAATMTGWARALNGHAEAALGREDWARAREVGRLAASAARDPDVRYLARVRHIAGYLGDPAEPDERVRELFRLFVERSFPGATWDAFLRDMTTVQLGAAAREEVKTAITEYKAHVKKRLVGLKEQFDAEVREAGRAARDQRAAVEEYGHSQLENYWEGEPQRELIGRIG